MYVRFKKLHSEAQIPQYQSDQAAGMDLHWNDLLLAAVHIPSGNHILLKTGLAMQLPRGYEAQIRSRSGLAYNFATVVLNSPGTIDADYRGEIGVIIINHGDKTMTINRGDRIAQMVINELPGVNVLEVEELDGTERGADGFGSTGES